jgi:hypothetical protein
MTQSLLIWNLENILFLGYSGLTFCDDDNKKYVLIFFAAFSLLGASGRIQTHDLVMMSQALCPCATAPGRLFT